MVGTPAQSAPPFWDMFHGLYVSLMSQEGKKVPAPVHFLYSASEVGAGDGEMHEVAFAGAVADDCAAFLENPISVSAPKTQSSVGEAHQPRGRKTAHVQEPPGKCSSSYLDRGGIGEYFSKNVIGPKNWLHKWCFERARL